MFCVASISRVHGRSEPYLVWLGFVFYYWAICVDWFTAEVWQTRDKRTEADLSRECQDIAVLHIQYSWCKRAYKCFHFYLSRCHRLLQ